MRFTKLINIALFLLMAISYSQQSAARFLQTDPIGYKDDMDLYTYVHDDPVNHTDPTGTETPDISNGQVPNINPSAEGLIAGVMIAAQVIPIANGFADAALAGRMANVATKLSRAEQLAVNKATGKAAENTVAKQMGDKVAGQQVTIRTSDGTKTVADIVTKDKGIVEVKSGGGQLSSGQQKLFDDVANGREVTPVGANAEKAGLRPGEPTTMNSCTLTRVCK